jgi:hypothetical protein
MILSSELKVEIMDVSWASWIVVVFGCVTTSFGLPSSALLLEWRSKLEEDIFWYPVVDDGNVVEVRVVVEDVNNEFVGYLLLRAAPDLVAAKDPPVEIVEDDKDQAVVVGTFLRNTTVIMNNVDIVVALSIIRNEIIRSTCVV